MGQRRAPDGWGDPPSEVQITVLQDPGDRCLWTRLPVKRGIRVARRAYCIFVAAAAVAVIAVILVIASVTGHASGSHGVKMRARERGPTGVAAAYGYPTRCLSVTISSIDPAFARADFDHGSVCGRFAGDPTAIFHVIHGSWRPVLEAVSYSCPAAGIPEAVQRQLGVCPGTSPSRRPRWVPSGHSRAGHAPWAGKGLSALL